MNKRLTILTFLVTTLCSTGMAQTQDIREATREINKVKLDGSYIWAEGTSRKNEKDALSNALAVLNFEVQNWLKTLDQKEVTGVVMPTNDQCMKIDTQRGSLYRTFVYVAKDQIMPLQKNEKVVVVEKAQPKPAKKGSKEELKSEYEPIYEPSPFEQKLLTVKKSNEMATFIKQNGIKRHGKYKERPEQGKYYLFVYNKQGEIPTCLMFADGILTNVATGKEDSFDNYKGCGAHWLFEETK